jgi:hypothetical protein
MGLCSSSRTAHRDVISPQGDNHAQIEIEFASLLNLENPHNINHKYIYLYKAVPDAWVGRTIKKTHAYVSFVSLQEIRKKREEFWGKFLIRGGEGALNENFSNEVFFNGEKNFLGLKLKQK